MSALPILSVIVPVYNVARFLPSLLTKLSHQTLKNLEVILVCDGNAEDFEICHHFIKSDKRFSLISNVKKGLGGARNAGLDKANGEYIFFCDADDKVDEDFCKKMIEPFLKDRGISFTACGTQIVFESKINSERKILDDRYFSMPSKGKHYIDQNLFGGLNVGVWNKIYRRDLIQKYDIRFPENMCNEDAYFNWCYWAVSECFYSLPEVKYFYVRRDDSLMGQTFLKNLGLKALHHLKIAEMFYEFLERNSLLQKYNQAFWNCYLISYWFARDNSAHEWQHKVKQYVYSFLLKHSPPSDSKFKEIQDIFLQVNSKLFKKKISDMTTETAITAVLPVFKCEQYLHRCVDSILSQTLSNIEVILAVDGGEECYRICDEYAAKDSRVKVIRDKGSYGKSVNAGILSASGEYISIIECDDWCEPDMLEVLYNTAKQYDADVVKGGWFDSFDDPKKNQTRLFEYPDGFFNIYEHQDFFASQPSVWSAIYRKEYLIDNHIFFYENRQSFVDAPFHYKTLYCTEDYVLINKPLYHYYHDNPNQSVQSGGKVYDGLNAEKFAYGDIQQYPDLWSKIGQGIFASMLEHLSWNDGRIKDQEQHNLFEVAAADFLSSIDLKGIDLGKLKPSSRDLFNRLICCEETDKVISSEETDKVTSSEETDKVTSFEETDKVTSFEKTDKFIFRFFGFLPLFSIEKRSGIAKFKLFTKINLFSVKKDVSTKRFYLMKFIPLLVVKRR